MLLVTGNPINQPINNATFLCPIRLQHECPLVQYYRHVRLALSSFLAVKFLSVLALYRLVIIYQNISQTPKRSGI
jgi:hypothetical protein